METITANCPKCNTQYELTDEQLSVAGGQVRCGSCMTVFQAREAEPEVPAAPVESKEEIDDPVFEDAAPESAFLNNEEDFSDSFTSAKSSDDGFGSLLDSSEFAGEMGGDDDSDEVEADEDWAEQLLDDEDEDPEAYRSENEIDHTKALGTESSDFDGFDDDLILQQPDEDEGEALAFSDVDNPFDEKQGLLKRITPEPLEFHMIGRGKQAIIKAFYSVLTLVSLAGLVGQYVYFQFDDLARQPTWRPVYTVVCPYFGCQLPSLYNSKDISAKNLTVKSHAYYEGALVVDTIITNHANIAQPFPQLELYFTDNEQKIVAARRFSPDEYLRGELTSKTLMPSRQPVHLAVEINDPGGDASGYRVELSYANDK